MVVSSVATDVVAITTTAAYGSSYFFYSAETEMIADATIFVANPGIKISVPKNIQKRAFSDALFFITS